MNSRLQESIDELLNRDDVWVTRETVEEFFATGKWQENSFVDFIENHARRDPNAPAMIDEDGTTTTYGQFHERSNRLAAGMLRLGLEPGDTIAIQLPNVSEFLITLIAAAKIRILPVLCHMPYTENDMNYILELTGARALFIPDQVKSRNYVEMARKLKQSHEQLEQIVVLSERSYENTHAFSALDEDVSEATAARLAEHRPVGTDPFFLMFTSGTTGKPKAELHLHCNNTYWVNRFNDVCGFAQNAKWLLVTPLAHLTGLGVGALGAFYRGAPVVLLKSWDVEKAVEVIERDKPSYFLGAPPMLIDFARYENLEARHVESIRTMAYAGATCPKEILDQLIRKMNCNIIAFYGYTEAGVTHCTQPGDSVETTSISFGRIVDGLEEKLVGEDGDNLEPPCQGEMVVRGAGFIPGYYRQPEKTKRAFDGNGWFYSSDIVRKDEEGYCTFVSRKDDLINRGGYKIDPREIEEVLYTHPRIAQAAVVAFPDERLGQRAAAFIVPKQPGDVFKLEEVTRFLSEKGVAKTHWPEAVQMIDHFPMTSTGKFQRYALREKAVGLKTQR
ncbi:MAG TPA: class I adenylate-forming enzyme family protein [Bacillales bacterium]|nr:class I adenylate-forming enzyme family protein [Bacillales bacterium]